MERSGNDQETIRTFIKSGMGGQGVADHLVDALPPVERFRYFLLGMGITADPNLVLYAAEILGLGVERAAPGPPTSQATIAGDLYVPDFHNGFAFYVQSASFFSEVYGNVGLEMRGGFSDKNSAITANRILQDGFVLVYPAVKK